MKSTLYTVFVLCLWILAPPLTASQVEQPSIVIASVTADSNNSPTSIKPRVTPTIPGNKNGWSNLKALLVPSDGSRSLGNPKAKFNKSRDNGSKIVYFDAQKGDNKTAKVYWWDGNNILDSAGKTKDANGNLYGTDPRAPNEKAIHPFHDMSNAANDNRLKTQQHHDRDWFVDGVAGGYPDWFLFKRGQTHTEFNAYLFGGRNEKEPMVVSAYGNLANGRAIFRPSGTSAFLTHNYGKTKEWIHLVIASIEFRKSGFSLLGSTDANSYYDDSPVTLLIEDCKFFNINGNSISYLPQKTTIYRTIVTHGWHKDSHNQGYYASGYKNHVTIEDSIFYRNGFKEDPLTNADPRRDFFSRNIYQGGGAQMGHTYRNIISAEGASGGPQMRIGGLMENSLIMEGYFYSSTSTNDFPNEWMAVSGQQGQSALVRNNVQLIYKCNSPADPDNPLSSGGAQPGNGYAFLGAGFGSLIENNIISGASIYDELQTNSMVGLNIKFGPEKYGVDTYNQTNNQIINNIFYRVHIGIFLEGNAKGASNNTISNNAIVSLSKPIVARTENESLSNPMQVDIRNNRFYSSNPLLNTPWIAPNNTLNNPASAAIKEGWQDPNRTLKRYVIEVLGLTLLDWKDDPYVDKQQAAKRIRAGESYDPTGVKTFMAVASNMRFGGKSPTPKSGKPDIKGDYAWNNAYTGKAVVNWVREGFGLPAIK